MLHIFSNSSNLAERVFLMRAIQSASAPLHFPAGQPNTFLCGYSIQIIILTSFHQNWAKVIFFNRTTNTHQRNCLDTWCCLLMHAGNFLFVCHFLCLTLHSHKIRSIQCQTLQHWLSLQQLWYQVGQVCSHLLYYLKYIASSSFLSLIPIYNPPLFLSNLDWTVKI